MAETTPTITPQPGATPAPATATPAKPAERVKGRLTRHGMEQALKAGGSVLHGERIITNAKDLPSEAELASGDIAAEDAARASIAERQAALDRESAILNSRAKAAQQSPKK